MFGRIFLLLIVFLIGCGSDNPIAPVPEPKSDHTTGDLVIDLPGGVKMAFIWIEPGTFMMGMDENNEWISVLEGPKHQVTITKGFYLGKYEVTQKQWNSLVESKPWVETLGSPANGVGDDYPAANMHRRDEEAWMVLLNESVGEGIFRLPTEAEWEYACRAGKQTDWPFGNDWQQLKDYAWYDVNSNGQAQPVGLKLPNPWGLYDMHGNIQEWMLDGWRTYTTDPEIDPIGPPAMRNGQQISYLEKGGSWLIKYYLTQPGKRLSVGTARATFIGFRVLLEGPKL